MSTSAPLPATSTPGDLKTPEELMAERPSLTTVRLRAAMSMNELARTAGVSPNTVMDVERGARPRMSTMRKLAVALGVAPQDIAWPGDPFSKLDPEDRQNGEGTPS
jgi:transcriptional regulator with XRE-family HTH domain